MPVAQKAPLVTKTSISKKDPSEASYSNNRPQKSYTHVVAYTPTASREGAGQMFYMNKTNPTGAKAGASFATSCIPYAGDVKDIQEAVTGKDLITGKKLTGGDRALTITAAVLPVVSGPMLKGAAKGGKIVVEEAPDAVKGAEKLIKKNVPTVKKAVKNTDVAEDTAKAMKKRAVKQVKDAGKEIELSGKRNVVDVAKLTEEAQRRKKVDILNRNKVNGKVYEEERFSEFASGYSGAQKQVTIKTDSGTKTRVDAIGFDADNNVVINEFKSSQTASLTKNQSKAFPEIEKGGGVVMGKGKGIFSGGYEIPSGTKVTIIRKE